VAGLLKSTPPSSPPDEHRLAGGLLGDVSDTRVLLNLVNRGGAATPGIHVTNPSLSEHNTKTTLLWRALG
jgi:hypothetical protein